VKGKTLPHDPIEMVDLAAEVAAKEIPDCDTRFTIIRRHIQVSLRAPGEEAWASKGVAVDDIRRDGMKPLLEAITDLHWLATTLAGIPKGQEGTQYA
jgi:hypothetical protein